MSVHLGVHLYRNIDNGNGKETFYENRLWFGNGGAYYGTVDTGYGIYAFIKRDIGTYMLLRSHFVFFDYEELLIFFYLDYIAVMGLFILIGNYVCAGLKVIGRGNVNRI